MSEKTPENLDNLKYQVFLYSCPGNLPFSFVTHHWFVINKLGVLERFEILFRRSNANQSHLYKNFLPPFYGLEIFPFVQKYFWKGEMLGYTEGTVAMRIAEFIEQSPESYPFCQNYFLTEPNSNTYVQWILNNFPEFHAKLPWNAVGKNYKYDK